MPAIDDIREEFVVRGTKASGRSLQFRNLMSLSTQPMNFIPKNITRSHIRQKHSAYEIDYNQNQEEIEKSRTCSDYLYNFKHSKRIIVSMKIKERNNENQYSTYEEIMNLCKVENEIKATCSEDCVTIISKAEAYRRILGKSQCSQMNKTDVSFVNEMIQNFTEKLMDKKSDYFISVVDCWIMRFLYYIIPLKSSNFIRMDYPGISMIYYDFIEIEMYKIDSIYGIILKNNLKIIGTKTENENEIVQNILKIDLSKEIYVLIIILLLLYSCGKSLIITCFTFFLMSNAILISYIVYIHVFKITSFPFINFLNFIILLALGTDDIFIFTLKWNRIYILNINENLKILKTIESSLSTIFATSFSTILSLLFCFTSSIVAIKCFSCFGVLLIGTHFVLVFIFLPSICYLNCSKPLKSEPNLKFHQIFQRFIFDNFCRIIIKITIKFYKPIFIQSLLLIFLAITSLLFYPKLVYPKFLKNDILKSNHPNLVYNKIKNEFTFERNVYNDKELKWIVSLVWGVIDYDNRSWLNFQEYSKILIDKNWKIADAETIDWLNGFCSLIDNNKETPEEIKEFIQLRKEKDLSNCPYDEGIMSVKKFIQLNNCSFENQFPKQIKVCLNQFNEKENSLNNFQFHYQNDRIVGMIIYFDMKLKQNETYENIVKTFTRIENWFQKIMDKSPVNFNKGFVVFQSEYDSIFMLYSAIANYLPISFSMAFFSAGLVGFLLLWNWKITGIMLLVLFYIVCFSVATLVWFNWKIGIIEAAIFTVATGLGIDFCLHFAIAIYKRKNKSTNVNETVERALLDVFWPVILTGLTTCLPGIPLINSYLLIFNKLGLFLFVVTFWSIVCVLFIFPSCILLIDLSMLKLQNSVDRYQIDKV